MATAPALSVIHDPRRAATLLDPLRLRLLEQLSEPNSASGLARQLRLPRQKVNYHLRELEKAKLVKLVEERRKGNCIERVVRATAVSYVIDPAALGKLAADPANVRDRFSSAYLVAVSARAIREVAALRAGAEKAGKKLATMTLETEVRFASAETRNAFAEELASAVADLTAKYHDEKSPGGRRFRFFVGGYPKPKKEES
ncbi:MAG: helix-turn-helix domain-containing protein [Acidobacteria bacterium]|nr:helix-turn-helix domain-containing protein [Acidobacteriota bacterium]